MAGVGLWPEWRVLLIWYLMVRITSPEDFHADLTVPRWEVAMRSKRIILAICHWLLCRSPIASGRPPRQRLELLGSALIFLLTVMPIAAGRLSTATAGFSLPRRNAVMWIWCGVGAAWQAAGDRR